MPEQPDLTPVFIPPLAAVLAFAEKKKRAPLTPDEVLSIRDRAACIMMERADSAKMAESRGCLDVNPESCWGDWHRLRTQMTGRGYLPKLVLCVPGSGKFGQEAASLLTREGVEYEVRPHDPLMVNAFHAASISWPSLTDADSALLSSHTTVVYLVSPNYVAGDAVATARRFVTLARRVLDIGGIAIKCESSGIAHSAARWRELADATMEEGYGGFDALFRALVAYPIGSATELYTCGMHLLGEPDLILDPSILGRIPNDAAGAAALFRTFGTYLLAECSSGRFTSGHTFSASAADPKYRILWEPCIGYEEDDLFFNPFGRWRFTEAERIGR